MPFGFASWEDDVDSERPMFGPKPGSWSVSSKEDPRFNLSGQGLVGGFMLPDDAAQAIKQKSLELGVEAPADLEYWYFKD